jgi:tetratricopeptide (TPR) repeat protein
LRPECPGSIEISSWLNGEVVGTVGAGIALATIARERETESLAKQFADPVFWSFEAEAYLLKGEYESVLEVGRKALQGLPESDILPRARVAAITAEAAKRLGQYDEAMQLLESVVMRDPGVIRRLGFSLPVSPNVSGLDEQQVSGLLEVIDDSPMFEVVPWGFNLEMGPESVGLSLANGTQILSVRVPKAKNTDEGFQIRQIARTAHFDLLVPKVDVTQSDIRSLDGGLLGGGRASEKVKSILKDLVDPKEPGNPQ